MKQLLHTISLGALLLGASLPGRAQEMGNARYQEMGNARYGDNGYARRSSRGALTTAPGFDEQSNIFLHVSGLSNVAPTSFVAMFNIIQVANTPELATSLLRERLHALTRGLAGLGIDSTRLRTDVISFVPRYETQVENRVFSKRFNEVPAGFELQETVSIAYQRAELMQAILRVAAQAEVVDLVKVDVSVADARVPAEQLREQCLLALKTKERALVAAGFRLDTLQRVPSETSATTYPVSHYSSYQAAARPSLEAARASRSLLGGQPKVTEARQATAYYYDPVAPDQYDVVLNPVVTSPVIQFSYSLAVRYSPRKPKARNRYFLLNANGEAKPIKLEP
ncbi:MAG: SIMPL domain-containing protein [Janthinobacterium lividum]